MCIPFFLQVLIFSSCSATEAKLAVSPARPLSPQPLGQVVLWRPGGSTERSAATSCIHTLTQTLVSQQPMSALLQESSSTDSIYWHALKVPISLFLVGFAQLTGEWRCCHTLHLQEHILPRIPRAHADPISSVANAPLHFASCQLHASAPAHISIILQQRPQGQGAGEGQPAGLTAWISHVCKVFSEAEITELNSFRQKSLGDSFPLHNFTALRQASVWSFRPRPKPYVIQHSKHTLAVTDSKKIPNFTNSVLIDERISGVHGQTSAVSIRSHQQQREEPRQSTGNASPPITAEPALRVHLLHQPSKVQCCSGAKTWGSVAVLSWSPEQSWKSRLLLFNYNSTIVLAQVLDARIL